MKKLLFIITSMCVILTAGAQNDTIPETKELQEIVVEATNQYTSADGSTYIPSKRQKNSAADAVSLLSHMAIPQIDVNPADRTIKTATGKDIAIFIDFIPATSQDLEGMQTGDVKKVEYLLYPQDPRFQGKQYVINFIMQKYEWGGYTKLNAQQSFSVNETMGALYSKFTYKRMTFDLYANTEHNSSRHNGQKSTEQFNFTNLYEDGAIDIKRSSHPISSRLINKDNGISFRAIYSAGKTRISNSVAFGIKDTPTNELESSLDYSDNIFPPTLSHTAQSDIKRTVDYNFLLTHTINSKTSFNILANYIFGHNNSNYSYSEEDANIINNATEDSHYAMLSPQFVWTINEQNSLVAYMFWEYIGNHVKYSGDSPADQNYYLWGSLTGVRYVYHREKWQAGTQVGCSYARTGLEGYPVSTDIAPKGNVFATYAPNQKNQFELFYGFGKNIPGIYQKSPTMLQHDRLMWYTGNPDLKSYWDNWVSLTYTWLPNNIWQLNATSDYFTSTNCLISDYRPDGPDGTMLRRYMNDGDFRRVRVGITGTGKFLDNRLTAKVSPMLYLQSTTGTYAMRKNILTCSEQLT